MLRSIQSVMRRTCSLQIPARSLSSNDNIIKEGIDYLRENMSWTSPEERVPPNTPPDDADVVIIGGGIMGSSIAYFLKRDESAGLKVVVLERDNMYTRASTVLSVGGIRQQFSNAENIQLSMQSAEFLKNARESLCVGDQDPPDLQFNQQGYLLLASESGVQTLLENNKIQKECGASVELLTPRRLKEQFPWLNTEGIELASYGLENEGWFDPWSLLKSFKMKATSLGVEYFNADVSGFEVEDSTGKLLTNLTDYSPNGRRITRVEVSFANSPAKEYIKAPVIVLAAGAWSGELGYKLGIGLGSEAEYMHVPIPVCPRKRYIYVVHCPNGPGLDCPLMVDPCGVYFRREGLGGNYLVGRSPSCNEEPLCNNLDVDYDYFDETIWEKLAFRVPAFESIKIKNAWAGFYDYNTFDQNGIIGYHSAYSNLLLATGFSGHGIQQAPAVGRAISELILENQFISIDLKAMGFHRVVTGQQLLEKSVI